MLFRKELPATPAPKTETDIPSVTALLVLVGLQCTLLTDIDGLFEKDAVIINQMILHIANQMAAIPGLDRWKYFIQMPLQAQIQYLEQHIAPEFHTHKFARKYMVKHKIESAIEADNIKQVVFVSGGYDPRAYLLARQFPGVKFYELDKGSTRSLKINALKDIQKSDQTFAPELQEEENYARFGNNLHLIQCDFLIDDLLEKLQSHQFNSTLPSLIIVEGLTMYLSKEDNQKLLGRLYDLLPDGCEILIGFRATDTNPTRTGDQLLAASKEPFKFVAAPQDLPAFFLPLGFETSAKMLCSDLLNWALKPDDRCRSDSYYLLRRDSSLKHSERQAVDINTLPLIEESILRPRKKYAL